MRVKYLYEDMPTDLSQLPDLGVPIKIWIRDVHLDVDSSGQQILRITYTADETKARKRND